jgi:glutamyl-tRNA synthetase
MPSSRPSASEPAPAGRFAPSPTGPLHLGNLRTALVAWLFARSTGRRFVIRMEDLDRHTSSPEWAARQLADLAELGLDWDGDVLRQSERFDLHRAALARLEAAGRTYRCWCTRREIAEAASAPHGALPRYPGTCRDLGPGEVAERESSGRPAAVRLRADHDEVTFVDAIAGPTTGRPDDVVLQRNDGVPAYHLAVVVDDADQGVDQVVRGDDLLDATPSQIHLATLLGYEVPTYAHVPLVVGPDGRRLAKRDGRVTLEDLAAEGVDAARVRDALAASLGIEGLGAADASALLDAFDPAALAREPWRYDGTLPG